MTSVGISPAGRVHPLQAERVRFKGTEEDDPIIPVRTKNLRRERLPDYPSNMRYSLQNTWTYRREFSGGGNTGISYSQHPQLIRSYVAWNDKKLHFELLTEVYEKHKEQLPYEKTGWKGLFEMAKYQSVWMPVRHMVQKLPHGTTIGSATVDQKNGVLHLANGGLVMSTGQVLSNGKWIA